MKNLLLFLFLLCISAPSLFAGSLQDIAPTASSIVSIPYGAVYSDDGTHWASVDTSWEKYTLTIDGTLKATYSYISQPTFVANTVYAMATDEVNTSYLLRDGMVLEKGKNVWFVMSYSAWSYSSQYEGWYTVDAWVFRLKDMTGKVLIENMNAGTSSSAYAYAPRVIMSTIYDRNNNNSTTYINNQKISWSVSSLGIYKNGKKSELLLIGMNTSGINTEIIAYDMAWGKIRKLPWYDGIGSYATILDKKWNIKELQYSVMIGDKYAFADITGKVSSDARYDGILQVSSYGDKFFKSFIKNGKKYFHFDGKLYGPYDEIDTLNTSYGYGNNLNYQKIERWSIFARKDGKDSIIANGKEFLLSK